MVNFLVDTNILVDLLRNYQPATQWIKQFNQQKIGVSSIAYMEIVQGAPNKTKLSYALQFLSQFELINITPEDQIWAIRQLIKFNLSHNIHLEDALIASSAHRLNLPIYTRNTKHFLPMISSLVQQPY